MDTPTTGGLRGKRCLITGADGFLGRALSRTARAHGAIVSGFGRRAANSPLDIPWRDGDFADEAALGRALEEQDIVFHLLGSGTPAYAMQASGSILHNDVKLTVAMLELLQDRPNVTVVFASSGGAIYGVTAKAAVREDHETAPISTYGANKLIIEQYLAIYHRVYGLRYRTLRIANAYGPGQVSTRAQGFVAAAMRAALNGKTLEVWGDGSVVRDYVYVDDVAQAFISAALYDGEPQIFNVGSGRGRSLNEVLEDVAATVGRRCEVAYSHERPIDVPWNVLNADLIRSATGWRPATDWREGLQMTADWLRAAATR
jgi:UDP-glucose 4-epimerase